MRSLSALLITVLPLLGKEPLAPTGSTLTCTSAGKPICVYQMQPGPLPKGVPEVFKHGAYLHPIFTPSGKIVTGDHPKDHRWHRGLWMAWTKTEFGSAHPDFWNQGKGEGADKSAAEVDAEIRFDQLKSAWQDGASSGFTSRHSFIEHSSGQPVDVLHEEWTVSTKQEQLGDKLTNVIDLTSTQNCASSTALHLPEYHYGGLGYRGNEQWADHVTMLTSEGLDRKKGDSSKGRWVWMGGKVDGAETGVAILIHPGNFRFPQPLRLNPKNPQLCVAPSQGGPWSIEPGKPYTSRYRLLVVDATADAAWIEAQWKLYAGQD